MGYYSNFTITVDKDFDKIKEFISKMPRNKSDYLPDLETYYDELYILDVKWYNMKTEMKEFSKNFPDVLFTVDVQGEDHEDMWKYYVRNGKGQTCKAHIVYDAFDPDLMEE